LQSLKGKIMQIRIRSTGQVMYEAEFRQLHPTTFPQILTAEILNSIDADVVLDGPFPTATRYQSVARDGVEQIDGQWFTKWKTVDFSDEVKAVVDEQQAKSVREERDRKLKELDWTQGKDIPDSISGPAAIVRQALRDVPLQSGFPWEVTWPE
jgi:hypothetical protein